MTCPQLIDSGAYVLGALSPAARSAYERHLPGCAACRAEVSEMAGLPGLLGRLDPDAVPNPPTHDPAPPSVVAGALLRVRRQRHQRRLVASFAALALVALALVAGLALPRSSHPTPLVLPSASASAIDADVPMVPMKPVGAPGPVSAAVGVMPVVGGTRIYMTCVYGPLDKPPPAGENDERVFGLFVISRGHGEQAVGWWKATPGEVVRVPGITSWSIAGMKRIELRDDHGTVLLALNVNG